MVFSHFTASQVPLLQHILYHIMPYQHLQVLSLVQLYSHGDIVVYLLYTTHFVTLEEVKTSYSKATVILLTAGWVMENRLAKA